MILTRSTRLIQPQGPVEISPDFGGEGVVYLPNVRSGITQVAGTVARSPTQQGVSASYSAGAENKIERLTGSAPNGLLEFTQLVYLTPIAGGQVNDRGLFGNRNTTGITTYIQLVHQARDAAANGRFCYRLFYKPTAAATEVSVRTVNDSAADGLPSVVIATAKNGKLSIYHNGALQGSTEVTLQSVSGQLDLQFGNYYDNSDARRLSAQIHLGAFIPRGLGDAEVAALSRNPWQLFRPVQRRTYFDMGAGGGGTTHTVTAAPAKLGGTTTRPGLTQTHITTARPVTQGATVTRPAITQTHVVTARAVVQGSTVTRPGRAQGHQAGSTRPGFEMSSRKVYVKRGKRIHIFDTVEDADEWLEAEDKARQVVNAAKPKPQAKAKVFKALDEAVPHDVVRLDVVRSMVDYLGIPVEMPTLEARQDWAEVARVALMARQMQDEEDIELLLAA